MSDSERRNFLGGFWITSVATLGGRVLGLVRDIATASLLGLGEGGVMDAFVVAFRMPNLFRRVLGEGALATSYLPVLTAELERNRRSAWQLVSVLMTVLAVLLAALVILGELLCAAAWWWLGEVHGVRLLAGLSAALLPYLLLVCLSVQISTTLQALGHFRWPAIAPLLLNVCWLVAAWWVAPRFSPDKVAQAYVLAAAVVLSGGLQIAIQLPTLLALGFRFDFDWSSARRGIAEIGRAMAPMVLGLAVTQLNTVLDSFIAWGLAAVPGEPTAIAWLGGAVDYPMRAGAAAAIYYGERFYQFPVGILGLALATVIYPRLSRHAARGERDLVAADLTSGLRLIWFLTIPASVGLMLLAEPLAKVLFERGQFTAADTARAARVIGCYASGVWAYCAIPVVVRGYYALADRATPVRVGMATVALDLALNLTLIWPLAEAGLAVATSVAAAMQVAWLVTLFSRRHARLNLRDLAGGLGRTCLLAVAMAAAVAAVLVWLPAGPGRLGDVVRIAAAVGVGLGLYLGLARLLRMPELGLLLGRR